MAQILDLGKIRFNWAGAYSSTTTYSYNDVVTFGPNLYAFTSATSATNVDPTNTGSWTLVVQGFEWRGTWTHSTLYYLNDVVTDGVSAWISTSQHTSPSTGAITADSAFNLLALGNTELPSLISQSNKVLSNNGANTNWVDTVELTKEYLGSNQGQDAIAFETSATLTNAAEVVVTNHPENFAQIAFQNKGTGSDASTDFIAYTDTGNDNSGYIDMGITSSTFSAANYGITGPHDGYIFMSGPRGTTQQILLAQSLGGVVTLTTGTPHGWTVGQTVRVEGVPLGGTVFVNGEYTITAVTTSTVSYAAPAGSTPFVSQSLGTPGTAYRPLGTGNLVLATDLSGTANQIIFAAGGFFTGRTQMSIIPDQSVNIAISTASTSPTTGALVVAGGAGITGNINSLGSISTTGVFYGGLNAQTAANIALLSNTNAVFTSNVNSYAQIAFINEGNQGNSSTDFIAYPANGNDNHGYIDMGITSQSFSQAAYGITGPNDGYIFMSAPQQVTVAITAYSVTSNVVTITTQSAHNIPIGALITTSGFNTGAINGSKTVISVPTTNTLTFATTTTNTSGTVSLSPYASVTMPTGHGNLVLATDSTGTQNNIVFAAGGLTSATTQMTIIPSTTVNIAISTAATSTTTGALTVSGGAGLVGDLWVGGTIHAHGTLLAGDAGVENFFNTAFLTAPAAVFEQTSPANTYAQVALRNPTSSSSADFIAYPDNGNDADGWIDMGITGSTFNSATYGITGPNDGYLFVDAPNISPKIGNGNLVLATGVNGLQNRIVFAAGGFVTGRTQMTIIPDTSVNIAISTASTSTTTGALVVNGGVGLTGNLNVGGNVNITGNITFGGSGTQVTSANLAVTNPVVFVGNSNPSDVLDMGLFGQYVTGSTTYYAGIVRDHSTGVFKLLKTLTTKPTNTVNFADSTVAFADLQLNNLTINKATISGTPSASTDAATVSTVQSYIGTRTTVNSNYTMNPFDALWCDSSAGAFTLTLPANPTVNTRVWITDVASAFATNNVTVVVSDSSKIMGIASNNLILNVKNATVTLVYSGTTYGWRLV